MAEKSLRVKLEKMYKNCPEILTPMKAAKWLPIGKNAVYDAIKKGELKHFAYRGSYIITKQSVIDYIIKTADEKGHGYVIRGWDDDHQ